MVDEVNFDEEEDKEQKHFVCIEEFISVRIVEAFHKIHALASGNGRRKKSAVTDADLKKAIELISEQLAGMLQGTGDEVLFLRVAKRFGERLNILDKVFEPQNKVTAQN